MNINDTLNRDPVLHPLANNGQARITDLEDENAEQELRAELATFVCDGQYGDAMRRILESYVTQLGRGRQNSAWVSGFFGSGKSHLLKMLGHLWADTKFSDGKTARSLVEDLSPDILAVFRELEGKAAQARKPLVAAFGQLPRGDSENVRLTVLGIILKSFGFPEQYPQARFCFWLRNEGYLDKVRGEVEQAGKNWNRTLNYLYNSSHLPRAILSADPSFARDEAGVRDAMRAQFPEQKGDITTAEFISAVREAVAPDGGKLPLMMLILDEAQQYIGESLDRATMFTEMTEAIQTQMDSRVLLVASGQSALSAQVPTLEKIKDRFVINVQLSDTDVEAVIRKVILQKKPSAAGAVESVLHDNAGEISKHLAGSRIGSRPEDRTDFVADYPLLPSRRRFWEICFRSVDTAGTQSQLRSQLRIVHDALAQVARRPLGHTITADALFAAIATELVTKGVLLNELNNRIASLDDGTPRGDLRKGLCGLAFLISRLPREGASDIGVRATADMLADLLVEDVRADSGPFRHEVAKELAALANDGTLMLVGDEYRLQTTEGAEWDRACREQMTALKASPGEVVDRRDQLFAAAVQDAVKAVKLLHGQAKIKRDLLLHFGSVAPPPSDQIVVWARDGWSTRQKDVAEAARQSGAEDPTVHVFLPKKAVDELDARIIESAAAGYILEVKGHPTTAEGQEARKAMQSRLDNATAHLDALLTDILATAHVYKGGGAEVAGLSLPGKLEEAAFASLARMYPRFDEADHPAATWETVRRRAQDGDDQPFALVAHKGPVEKHPIGQEVIAVVGAGASGSEIRKSLQAAPFGWPRDAIDAAIVGLVREGVLRATTNGQPTPIAQLDQNRIPKADFRVESTQLKAADKLAVRSLYIAAGLPGKSGDEEATAPVFIQRFLELAEKAGGEPPLPPPPDTKLIKDIGLLSGNERLAALAQHHKALNDTVERCKDRAELASKRTPRWHTLQAMLHAAEGLPVVAEVAPEAEAVRANCTLLEKTDYVAPLLKKTEDALRDALKAAHAHADAVHEREARGLDAAESWQKLDLEQRQAVALACNLRPIPELTLNSQADLLAALSERPLRSWAELAEGLPTRFEKARAEAARRLEPKTQIIKLKSDTLTDEAAVKDWLAGVEKQLVEKLKHGPVVVS